MLLIILAYLGGALTILSPCILPVLPFVFSTAGLSFRRGALPLLAGMVLMFSLVATLAVVGGGWVVAANQYGRWLAMALIAVFALALLLPRFADRMARPFVSAGNRLTQVAQKDGERSGRMSFLLGIATGLLWAPCAGPILGLVLTGAALNGPSLKTTVLLLAYAAGAATSLALALLVGGKVFTAMKRSLGTGEWLRRGLGGLMLAGVAAIALGLDTGLLAQVSVASTGKLEQSLVDSLGHPAAMRRASSSSATNEGSADIAAAPDAMMRMSNQQSAMTMTPQSGAMAMAATHDTTVLHLPVEGSLPSLDGALQWLNSPPLSVSSLRGKVVLIDFWTYSCINCLRTLPYIKAWNEKYSKQGLVIIGVHAPEFAFERDVDNVKSAMKRLGITYPVAIDNNYAIWRAFNNQYWPAHYFIDAQGRVRYHHFGEGNYEKSEQVIQQLLREAGASVDSAMAQVHGSGVEAAGNLPQVGSPETYLGYARAQQFASGPVSRDQSADYRIPKQLSLNQWGLAGAWTIGAERATLDAANGRISFRFRARDLHLVLGPGPGGKPIPFTVTVDGEAPGDAHGVDLAPDGSGTVTDQRLYQLVRMPGDAAEHLFSIEFSAPGVSAYAFTFG
ncbi:cytochrome c biogenesis protein DipZ [Allopusillimonas soli]|uniref:Cytochrome c biogenesis protein DipZ n=1 Tax=Allopusillimonas soli TaxID=659016 RepID=A0A853FDN7_9BURK|nr:cytochrome c biogenesis protein DipZ [Allopusillimonas soli]NYT38994.1 cytochrome c biogenesis protein DipZ [Allopusillimonas soli]TEA69564.1 cytochrome c biogenesis protein DipZ [Allopusillimonas soli]